MEITLKSLEKKNNYKSQPMDIIFPKHRTDWISRIIRYFDKGDTSHAEIVIDTEGHT